MCIPTVSLRLPRWAALSAMALIVLLTGWGCLGEGGGSENDGQYNYPGRDTTEDLATGKIVYSASSGGELKLHVVGGDGNGHFQLTYGLGDHRLPRWTESGQRVVFVKDDTEIWRVDSDGSNETRVIRTLDKVAAVVWSPDANKIAYLVTDASGNPKTVKEVGPGGTQNVNLVNNVHSILDGNFSYWLSWETGSGLRCYSQHGRFTDFIEIDPSTGAYVKGTVENLRGGIQTWNIVDAAGTSPEVMLKDVSDTDPVDQMVATQGGYAGNVYGGGGGTVVSTTLSPRRGGAAWIRPSGVNAVLNVLDFSSGKMSTVFDAGPVDRTGGMDWIGTQTKSGGGTGSSDILFAGSSGSGFDLYSIKADGSGKTTVFAGTNDQRSPAWSPDRSQIAYAEVLQPGSMTIFVKPLAGSPVRMSDLTWEFVGDFAWSPDGSKIAFSARQNNRTMVFIMTVATKEVVQWSDQTQSTDRLPAWSPDSSLLLYAKDAYLAQSDPAGLPGNVSVFGGSQINGTSPDFLPDGSKVVFNDYGGPSGEARILTSSLNGQNIQVLATMPYGSEGLPRVSPDGQFIVVKGLVSNGSYGSSALYVMRTTGGSLTKIETGFDQVELGDW